MISIDAKINEFKKYYDSKLEFHNSAVEFFTGLIISLPKVESISGRVKNYDECISKFKRKYLPILEPENRNYKIHDYLTDLIGIRVICFYLEDVTVIRKKLKKYFHEIDITDKTGQLEKYDDKFGYRSLHLCLSLKKGSNKISEFKRFKNVRFELQIRTIIQNAWSMLDHKIKYKKSIPQSLRRRINRLSALFEVADDEFLRIKEEIIFEEKRIAERLRKGDVIAKDKSLDVFRFLFIALKYFPEYNFIEYKVDGFVMEILELNKNFTESDLNKALHNHLHTALLIADNEKKSLNPYTKIRYCLYLYDQKVFSKILSGYQHNTIKEIRE
ncbi:MAG: hypothetical protein JSV24_07580 [Bacteroidales bacterium]|nr:MAG: hypothetical protein JSV24_07580 [Bacteroidales bacterium]